MRLRQSFVDSGGLVWEGRGELDAHKREFALRGEDLAALGLPIPPPRELPQLIGRLRPTVMIGTTGQPGDFTPGVIQAMAKVASAR